MLRYFVHRRCMHARPVWQQSSAHCSARSVIVGCCLCAQGVAADTAVPALGGFERKLSGDASVGVVWVHAADIGACDRMARRLHAMSSTRATNRHALCCICRGMCGGTSSSAEVLIGKMLIRHGAWGHSAMDNKLRTHSTGPPLHAGVRYAQ